jgi:hypothetical protein
LRIKICPFSLFLSLLSSSNLLHDQALTSLVKIITASHTDSHSSLLILESP